MKHYKEPQTEIVLISVNQMICTSPATLGVGGEPLDPNSIGD